MPANTTAFGEADVIAVMRHYFSKTSTFHGDFSTYFSALTSVYSEHTSSLAWPPKWLATFSISDTFSTENIIFDSHTKTLFQAIENKQNRPAVSNFVNSDCTGISV